MSARHDSSVDHATLTAAGPELRALDAQPESPRPAHNETGKEHSAGRIGHRRGDADNPDRPCSSGVFQRHAAATPRGSALPVLLTVADVAACLRTTKKAVYELIARGQLPGVIRIGRRVLVREESLILLLSPRVGAIAERIGKR
jgi:excisionase family DNA binding protein